MTLLTSETLKPLLSEDGVFTIRVTPKAASNRITLEDGRIKVYITTVAEDGKATKAALKLLAKTLKIPVSALTLITGEKSREKTLKLDTSRLKP